MKRISFILLLSATIALAVTPLHVGPGDVIKMAAWSTTTSQWLPMFGVTTTGPLYVGPDHVGRLAIWDVPTQQWKEWTGTIPTASITAGNWKTFYSDGSGTIQELPLGLTHSYLGSSGPIAAPTWDTIIRPPVVATNICSTATIAVAGDTFRIRSKNTSATNLVVKIGWHAGYGADNAYSSHFEGVEAGNVATYAHNSFAFCTDALNGAPNATNANALGYHTLKNSGNGAYCNIMGYTAAEGATTISESNVFGFAGAKNATGAKHSNGFGSDVLEGASGNYIDLAAGDSAAYGETHSHVILLGKHSNATADSEAVYGNDIKRAKAPMFVCDSIKIGGMAVSSIDTTAAGSTKITFSNGRYITFTTVKGGP